MGLTLFLDPVVTRQLARCKRALLELGMSYQPVAQQDPFCKSRIRPLTSAVPRRPDRCKKWLLEATPTPGTKRLFVHRSRFQTGAQSVPMDFKLLICPGFAVLQTRNEWKLVAGQLVPTPQE
jgi:hypothetical protein